MKKTALMLLMILTAGTARADRILLRDMTVLEGTVIRITDGAVEYDPSGDSPFGTVPRDRVMAVRYDDGRVIAISIDTVEFIDGSVRRGVIREVGAGSVIFIPEGSHTAETIDRAGIRAITLADGSVHDLRESSWTSRDAESPAVPVRGFRDSIVRVAVFFSFHMQHSPLFEKERRNLDLAQAYLLGNPSLLAPYAYDLFLDNWSWGADLDLMLPALGQGGSPGFSFNGVKIGIRGRYGYDINSTYLYRTSRGGIPLEYRYSARYLNYGFLGVGPVVNFIFSPEDNHFSLIIQAYLVYGEIVQGRLRPNASLRDAGILVSAQDYSMAVNGYTIRWGLGPHFCLNRWLPLTVGIHMTMASTRLRLPRPVLSYWSGRTRPYIVNNIGMEITLGVHL